MGVGVKMKGHWPKGKRRHSDDGVRVLITRMKRLLRRPVSRVISQRALAKSIGVSPRTVGRWLRREDCPSQANKRAWAKWLDEREK